MVHEGLSFWLVLHHSAKDDQQLAWFTELALQHHVNSEQQCTVADASTQSWLDDTVLYGAQGFVLLVGPAPQCQG